MIEEGHAGQEREVKIREVKVSTGVVHSVGPRCLHSVAVRVNGHSLTTVAEAPS